MPGPIATIGSNHSCPMSTGTVPHVGGPVVGPGVPTVLIGGKPAAVMGDQCICTGPPDVIVKGEATVLIGGKPAATVGSTTAHGGVIVSGEPTVLIGTGISPKTEIKPLEEIPFPEMKIVDRVLRPSHIKESKEKQEQIVEEHALMSRIGRIGLSI